MAFVFQNALTAEQRFGPLAKPEEVAAPKPQQGRGGDVVDNLQALAYNIAGSGADMLGAEGFAKYFYKGAEEQRETMSDRANAALSKSLIEKDEEGNWRPGEGATDFDFWLLHGTSLIGQAALGAIPGIGAASMAARAGLGAKAVKAAGAAGWSSVGGTYATGMAAQEGRQEIMQMPDEVLGKSQKFLQNYRELSKEKPELDTDQLWDLAKERLADQIANDIKTDPKVLIANYGLSAIADPIIGKALLGSRIAKSWKASAAKGAAVEGATEAAQAGTTQYGVNEALQPIDNRDVWQGVDVAAANEGIMGGVFGGTAGAIGGAWNRNSEDVASTANSGSPIAANGNPIMPDPSMQLPPEVEQALEPKEPTKEELEAELASIDTSQPGALKKIDKLRRQIRNFGTDKVYGSEASIYASKFYRDAVEDGVPLEIVPVKGGFQWRKKTGDVAPVEVKAAAPVVDPDADAIRATNPALAAALDTGAQSKVTKTAQLESMLSDFEEYAAPEPLPKVEAAAMPVSPVLAPEVMNNVAAEENAGLGQGRAELENYLSGGSGANDGVLAPQQQLPIQPITTEPAGNVFENTPMADAGGVEVPALTEPQSDIAVKLGAQPFQSKTEALASKQAQLMKKSGKVEAVPFGDGWGVRLQTQKEVTPGELSEGHDSSQPTSFKPTPTRLEDGAEVDNTLADAESSVQVATDIPAQDVTEGFEFEADGKTVKVYGEPSQIRTKLKAAGISLSGADIDGGLSFGVKYEPQIREALQEQPQQQVALESELAPIQMKKSGEPFKAEKEMKMSASYKAALASGAELETVKTEGGYGFRAISKTPEIETVKPVPTPAAKKSTAKELPKAVQRSTGIIGAKAGDTIRIKGTIGYAGDGDYYIEQINNDGTVFISDGQGTTNLTVSDLVAAKTRGEVTFTKVESEPDATESQTDTELPDILRMTKKKYIAQLAKQQKLKDTSPGYAQAVAQLEEQYESDVDQAQASLTFEQFNSLNDDSPESVNRQAYKVLREEFGLPVDLKFSKTSVVVSGKELGDYASLEDLWRKARDYGRENFSDLDVEIKDDNSNALIAWRGIKHTFSQRINKETAQVVVKLPGLIEGATLLDVREDKADRNTIKQVRIYESFAEIDGVVHRFEIVVREHADGKSRYYNHKLKPPAGISGEPDINQDSGQPSVGGFNQSIAQNSSNEQDGTADNKKPEQVRLIRSQLPLSGSPSQVSDANVSADDGAVKENPDIKFQAANSDTKKPTKSVTPEQARQVVNSIVKQLNGAAGIKVVVLDNQKQAEKQWQMSLEGATVRGAYDEQTKTAYVIAENIESLDQLREVVAHEVLAHGGLDTVIGKDKYQQFIDRLQQTRSNKLFKTLWAQIDADYDGASAQEKAEELFAYYAQNKPVSGPLKFWWNALKRWLHKALASVGLAKPGDPDIDAMDAMIESIRVGFMVDRVSDGKAQPAAGSERSKLAFSKTATADTRTAKEKLGLEEQARESIAQKAKARTKATIDTLKTSSFWQRMNEGIFDGMSGIKQAEESVGITDPNQQGYVSARLASGLADVLHAVFHYGAPEWRDGVVSRKADTKGMLEVFGMLGDDLNNWLAWMGANRAEKLMAEGRENNLTAADIAELKALANGKERLFEKVRQEYNKINSAVITLAQEAGLISPEQRGGFDEEWYVPFFRDMDVDPEMEGIAAMVQGPTSRKGIANQSAKIKELKGGKQSTKDLMENIIQRQSTLIDAALKNKAMLEVVNNLDGTDYMQAIDSPDIAALSQAELSKIGRVRVMHNGKAKAYAVSDPALLRGLLQINDAGSKSLFNRMARSAKRFLTAGITLSPDFIIKNFVRDATHAWMINKDDFKFGADSIKGIKKAFKEDELYRDLIFSGAAFQGGYVHGADPEAAAQQIRRTLAAKGLGQGQIDSYVDSLVTKGSQLFEMYRTASDKFENANRLSTFEAALTKGKSKRQAAFEAKDLMDYSLKGNFALIGTMIDMLPFFNARLQGMSKLVRAARAGDGDRVLKVLSANLAMKGIKVAAFSLALAAMNDDDERYQELPDWDKDANWHFFIGDDHFRIPKPFELGILFGTLPERLFNYGTGNQPASDLGKSVAHALFNTLALNPIPQIALPMVEVMTNRSFFKGSAIEGMADENKQAEDRYNAYTSDVAKLIGEAFGTSPKKVEHVIKGYTGTLGGYVLGIADAAARQIMGVESADTPISRYPVIKAFYQSDTPKTATKYQDEFYDALETATQAYGSYKRAVEEGDVVRQQELKEDEAKSLSSRVHLSRVQRQLSQLNKQAEIVNSNQALNGAQKRERLEDITRKKNALYQGAYVRFKLGEW